MWNRLPAHIVSSDTAVSFVKGINSLSAQFLVPNSTTSLSGVSDVCRKLERCVSAVHDWCTRRRLQLCNPSKTELIWFGSSANLERLIDINVNIHLGQAVIHPTDCVRDLGVLLDSSLSMRQHIAKTTSTCFFSSMPAEKITPCS